MRCGTTHFKEPPACTADELREFARLVRRGFDGSDEGLEGRIRAAKWLAFHYMADETLGAIAALKRPTVQYCDSVFAKAGASERPAVYGMELGWVFVSPEHRKGRIAGTLCRQLLARVPTSGVFATTAPDNVPMISILRALGFARVGTPLPHPRRQEELVALFVSQDPFDTTPPTT